MAPTSSLLEALRLGIAPYADPERATGQQRYLKTSEPMIGITNGDLRSVAISVAVSYLGARPDESVVLDAVSSVWLGACSRDERRAAIFILVRFARFLTMSAMPLIRQMVVEGAWWDLVDALVKVQRFIRRSDPVASDAVMREWAHSDQMWLRRYAIISQLGTRSELDVDLLVDCIVPNLALRNFFIAKSIGWALRDYSAHDPEWVLSFVSLHSKRMQPLSKHEALRRIANPRLA